MRVTKQLLDRLEWFDAEREGAVDHAAWPVVCHRVALAAAVALLVNETTLLPVLLPLAPATTLPARVGEQMAAVLAAHYASGPIIASDREQMRQWRMAVTANRSVVGIMNEFTFLAAAWRGDRADMLDLALRLAKTPCGPLYPTHGSPDRAPGRPRAQQPALTAALPRVRRRDSSRARRPSRATSAEGCS